MHYNLIDNYKLKVYRFKTKHSFNSIQYAGVKLGNSISVNFKICDHINAFRRHLDNWKCVKCNVLYHV